MPRRAAPTTYRDAYAALSRIAAELENGDADLDRVLPLIEEARTAYAVCRDRIEALKTALGEGTAPDDTQAADSDPDSDSSDDF
ncbi:exodeoxyribonuclease VII small subunit [Deinococcus sp. KNUC1210]|uniref:exodeoxyribonuclease VII small subunit n=1 Tax=Deinococcus sp. KNUC1210 TaxID=2917691 RepID=UPI001EF07322|nr:exodeoxyribonuclease VII small subunit [Deinococcus sp. KNUC1210]ULH14962.1 exodeoxyribonuclease VII small subunit [Deinococcus sp. KNUC1210]